MISYSEQPKKQNGAIQTGLWGLYSKNFQPTAYLYFTRKFLRLGTIFVFERSCAGQYAIYWNFKYTVRKVFIYAFQRYMIQVNRLRETQIICNQSSIHRYLRAAERRKKHYRVPL